MDGRWLRGENAQTIRRQCGDAYWTSRRRLFSPGGALHHHFPTKKSLGLAVIRERVAQAVDETWIAPVRAARTATAGILAAFDAIAASGDDRGRIVGCPLNNLAIELALADPDFQAAVGEIFAGWRKAISDALRTEKAGGRMSLDPDDVGTLVVASYSGAMAMAKANQTSEPLKTCARQLASLMETSRQPGGRTREITEHESTIAS
jgi:AcrR family transcriptional regulator